MKKNNKGFTLIELLAVIVILGILLMTAIPAITKNIAKSRRNTYWQNAKEYIKAVSTPFLAGEYVELDLNNKGTKTSNICTVPAPGNAVVIALDDEGISLEQGDIKKSSFGSPYSTEKCSPAIAIVNQSGASNATDKLVWYFVGVDKAGNGINKFTPEANLNLAAVKTGINLSNTDECDANRSTVRNDDNKRIITSIKVDGTSYSHINTEHKLKTCVLQ